MISWPGTGFGWRAQAGCGEPPRAPRAEAHGLQLQAPPWGAGPPTRSLDRAAVHRPFRSPAAGGCRAAPCDLFRRAPRSGAPRLLSAAVRGVPQTPP
jgi:hypothetical protein